VLGCGASAAVGLWPFSPSSVPFSQKYACRRSVHVSKNVAPFVPVYENWRHLRVGVQFDAIGLGNPYMLLDGGFSWTRQC